MVIAHVDTSCNELFDIPDIVFPVLTLDIRAVDRLMAIIMK